MAYTNGFHSRYRGKSNSIFQTSSFGASIRIDAETEKTPFDAKGGRFDAVVMTECKQRGFA